jgi:hypothetical protein
VVAGQIVDVWGRIYTVERLQGTIDEEIRDWMVRHGSCSTVMNEYLARIAATTGRLADRLGQDDPGGELVTAAGDIISALIVGGPAQDIDDYPDAPRVLERFVQLAAERAPRLEHFVVADDIRGFVRRPDGWSERYQRGWNTRLRAELAVACDQIISRPEWPELAARGRREDDHKLFWAAERAARSLGIDTFDAHWRWLLADPVTGNSYAVMQGADDRRIGQIVQFATDALDPDGLATGPADVLGMGPAYATHHALGFILQNLGRFPGRAWNLVRAGLGNPVVPVRKMAVKTLRDWSASQWPAEAVRALTDAARDDPAGDTRSWRPSLAEDEPMTTEDLWHGFERDFITGTAVNIAA